MMGIVGSSSNEGRDRFGGMMTDSSRSHSGKTNASTKVKGGLVETLFSVEKKKK